MRAIVETRFNQHSIHIETKLGIAREVIARKLVDLEDKAIKEAPVKLGWTPPKNEKE